MAPAVARSTPIDESPEEVRDAPTHGSIIGMTAARKLKVSVSLSEDLVSAIDQQVDATNSRSSIIEHLLRQAGRMQTEDALAKATVAYYQSLDDDARSEDAALARASSLSARKVLGTGAQKFWTQATKRPRQ